MADSDYPVTVRDLIEMLEKWEQDKEFNVFVQTNSQDSNPVVSNPVVVLEQKTNTIRLN